MVIRNNKGQFLKGFNGKCPKKIWYCVDCRKQVHYRSQRCYKCDDKFRVGINSPMFGKHHSKETRLKISKNRKGKKLSKESYLKGALNRSGSKHWNWNNGISIDKDKYILIKNKTHPYSNPLGYIRQHRLIVEKYLGRYLKPKEEVHHINHNKQDNRIENLMVFPNRSAHIRYECWDKCSQNKIIFDGSKLK